VHNVVLCCIFALKLSHCVCGRVCGIHPVHPMHAHLLALEHNGSLQIYPSYLGDNNINIAY